ncbi:MAG: dihydrofolate reductase [Actinomycetaceae bacterium]|nr:dihydrofolate reductase [Actinomycetaceae bacterium]MDU0970245.1 dihydrofolate reductase [Actinomycetaceae bacterium]
MEIALIWAQDRSGGIGTGDSMAWHVPADFTHFRACTTGCPIIMGRRTFDSLGRRCLPGRHSIVLTGDPTLEAPPATIVHSLDQALAACAGETEPAWIIGGAHLYAQALPLASTLVVTTVDLPGHLPVRAPEIPQSQWRRVPGDAERTGWRSGLVSDPDGTWREKSGDARWRVDVWERA